VYFARLLSLSDPTALFLYGQVTLVAMELGAAKLNETKVSV
jgi:hypothetical protein